LDEEKESVKDENGQASMDFEEVSLPDPDYDPTLDELAQANQERINRLAMYGVPVPTDLWWVTYMLEYLVGLDRIDAVRLAFQHELVVKLEKIEGDVGRARLAGARIAGT
jgi:hypothetical protein